MLGYEKVNKWEPRVSVDTVVSRPSAPRGRLIDLSKVAAESPSESIAYENEIVAHLALEEGHLERPSAHCIAEQLRGLVDPDVIRRHA